MVIQLKSRQRRLADQSDISHLTSRTLLLHALTLFLRHFCTIEGHNTKLSSQFQDNTSGFSIPCRKNRQKVEHVRPKPAFSHHFGRPPPLPSIPEPDFQQFYTSSRPRGYCQKTQLPDPVKDFPKEYPRNNHFCHLKYHIPPKELHD